MLHIHPLLSRKLTALAVASGIAACATDAWAVANWSTATSGQWHIGSNWSTGSPPTSTTPGPGAEDANLTVTGATYTVTYSTDLYGTARINNLAMSVSSGVPTVTLDVNAPNLRVLSPNIGRNATLNVNNGGSFISSQNININNTGKLTIASGGSVQMSGSVNNVLIGNASDGSFIMTGGSLSSSGTGTNGIVISTSGNNNTTASATVSGGAVTNAGLLVMGRAAHTSDNRSSIATLTISGAATTWSNTGNLILGQETGTATPLNVSGTLNFQNGTFTPGTTSSVFLGATKAVGHLNVSGGSFGTTANPFADLILGTRYTGDSLTLARGTGNFNLSGGQVHTKAFTASTSANTDGVANINFTGGTLHTGGTTVNNGSAFTVGNGTLGAQLNLAAGGTGTHSFTNGLTISANASLTGSGTINADTTINGTIAPGNSVGTITLDNDVLTLAGITHMELASAASYDQILGVSTLNFGGTLNVTTLDSFDPASNDSFNLFDFADGDLTFSEVNLPSLNAGLTWDTTNLYSDGVIAVVAIPEPASMALMGLGLACIAAPRRRATTRS